MNAITNTTIIATEKIQNLRNSSTLGKNSLCPNGNNEVLEMGNFSSLKENHFAEMTSSDELVIKMTIISPPFLLFRFWCYVGFGVFFY